MRAIIRLPTTVQGSFGKIWLKGNAPIDIGGGDTAYVGQWFLGVDMQFGFAQSAVLDVAWNKNRWKYNDMTPAGLVKAGR